MDGVVEDAGAGGVAGGFRGGVGWVRADDVDATGEAINRISGEEDVGCVATVYSGLAATDGGGRVDGAVGDCGGGEVVNINPMLPARAVCDYHPIQ